MVNNINSFSRYVVFYVAYDIIVHYFSLTLQNLYTSMYR